MTNHSIGRQTSLVKITYKSPDTDGYFDEYALMKNETLNELNAGFAEKNGSLVSISNTDSNATLFYDKAIPTDNPAIFRVAEEPEPQGFRSISWVNEISRLTIIMTDVGVDPHGYIEKNRANI